MEYQLKSGKIVTDEDIEAIAQDIENGKLPGKGWDGKVVTGRPRISAEPLVTVPVKFPASVVAAIDRKTDNRSEYIRKVVAASL